MTRPPPAARSRPTGWPARAPLAAGLGAGIALGAVVLPDLARLDRGFPMIGVMAFRPHTAAATTLAGAVLVTGRATRPVGLASLGVGVAGLAAVAGRAVTRPNSDTGTGVGTSLRRGGGGRAGAAAPGERAVGERLTVLTANVWIGRADTGGLAALLERERPDLVALPEAGHDFRDTLLPLITGLGYRSWVSIKPGRPDSRGVVLLAGPRAGDLRVRTGREMRRRYLEASGGILGDRRMFAVHPEAPIGRRRAVRWTDDLAQLHRWCHTEPPPIVAGDLNATLDHSRLRAALGRCRSVAASRGQGLVATFPAAWPRWAGIQIDHVLAPEEIDVERVEVLELAGSDHRAVLADLRLPPADRPTGGH